MCLRNEVAIKTSGTSESYLKLFSFKAIKLSIDESYYYQYNDAIFLLYTAQLGSFHESRFTKAEALSF